MALVYTFAAVANGAAAMYLQKEALKAQGWTVQSSSDGTTYNAAGDQITNGGAGAGGLNNNSAWFRIRSPAGSREYVVQRGTTEVLWRAKYSVASTFNAGAPNATTPPTAADQVQLAGTDGPTFVTMFGTAGTYNLETVVDNAAPYGFFNFCVQAGGTSVSHIWARDPIVNADVSDTDPYVNHFASSTGGGLPGAGPNTGSTLWSTSATNLSPSAHYRLGLAGAGYVKCGVGVHSVVNSAGSTAFFNTGNPTYHSTGEDALEAAVYMRPSVDAAPVGVKGVSYFLRVNFATRAAVDYVTIAGSRDWLVLGINLVLRWNNTTPAW